MTSAGRSVVIQNRMYDVNGGGGGGFRRQNSVNKQASDGVMYSIPTASPLASETLQISYGMFFQHSYGKRRPKTCL